MENDVSFEIADADASKNAFSLEIVAAETSNYISNDTPKTPVTTSTPRISHAEFEGDTHESHSLEAICSNDSLDRYMPLREVLQVSSCTPPIKSLSPDSGAENTRSKTEPSKNEPCEVSNALKEGRSLYKSHGPKYLAFSKNPLDEAERPDTTSFTPKSPKCKITPIIYHVDSEVDTPASPCLETVCSNDSLDMYMPLSKLLQVSPKKSACEKQSPGRPSVSGHKPKKNSPTKASSPTRKGPSPFKSYQPKYRPDGMEKPTANNAFKWRIYPAESEDDTPTSPDLKAVGSNDSFEIPITFRKGLKCTPKKTPKKKQSPSRPRGSKWSETSSRASDSQNKGPSVYKSHLPKYLPNVVKSPKAKATVKRRIYNTDSEDDTPGARDLEAGGSNDSFEIPVTFRKGLKCRPKKTPKKKQSPSRPSGSEWSENWSRARDSQNKGPSEYESHLPKYLSNDVKSPKARATAKRRIYNTDSEDHTPASSDLEAVDFNHSVEIFPIFREVFEACPRKTPYKKQSTSRPTGSGSNPQNKVPSPSKSHRPKYLPTNVKSIKAGTTYKRRIYHAESEDDTPASPNVETFSSNDSLLVPPTMRKPFHTSLKSTYTKTQSTRRKDLSVNKPSKNKRQKTQSTERRSESTPKNTPTKNSDPEDHGPSPYKYNRPKYLPKNIKLAKKKRQQREDLLKEIEVFDAQLVKLPALVTGTSKPTNPVLVNDGDLMGTQTPVIVYFHPKRFFANFNELTFDTYFDLNIAELARSMRLNPHLAAVKDYRNLTLFLTVTSDRNFFNIMSRHVEDDLIRNNFVLYFGDLKTISSNLGLTKESCKFDNTYFDSVNNKSPKTWNFTFFFMVLGHSFPSYNKNRLLRVLHFLGCCWFDPILQQCQSCVGTLIRRVSEHLILIHGATPDELVLALDHRADSWICNRVIVQILCPFPVFRPAAKALAYRSIQGILQAESEPSTLSHVADLLADVHVVRKKTGVKDIYQLITMCETLVSMAPSPFDSETKTFFEKLADFAENISLCYSYFENLYFMDTVTRLRTLSTVEGL